MKITLIFMAVLLAVVPVLGLSAPSASAEEVVSYPEVINTGDTIYFNPDLLVTDVIDGSLIYNYGSSVGLTINFGKFGSNVSYYSFVSGRMTITGAGAPSFIYFYFYSSDSSLVGKSLTTLDSKYPDYFFQESDLNRPILLLDSYIFSSFTASFSSDSLLLDSPVFSLTPFPEPLPETNFVGVWGETAEFVGDIFIQVGDLFYDDTAEELTPIGTLAVILAGIAVVLLVWNLIRSFLPMRG